MKKIVDKLIQKGELRVINDPVDINLEMAHIAYLEVKKQGGGDALLFTNAIDKKNNMTFSTPVLMNLYGSYSRTKEIFTKEIEDVRKELESLIKLSPPKTFADKLGIFSQLLSLKNVVPKSVKKGECQDIITLAEDVDLYKLPILTTWEEDGGPFITMGQVYTKSLDGKHRNLGMYRLQVYSKNTLGLHWQIHKDSSCFFDEYKKARKPMPVSIAIGGDPLYTWCGTAPLPKGIFELLLYGFIKKESAKLVKCVTNDLEVPYDSDIVIEGFIDDPTLLKEEGPFGDHTGYYTLLEPYPFLNVKAITTKKNPIYLATVVGKPPIEDKYMGWPTERIFLPLLQTTAPDLLDYRLPENGVFHNLILAKIKTRYPGHSQQIMHALWGVGQMSFVKHAIFVDESAPELSENEKLTKYILNRIDIDSILVSSGVIDALDHSSPKALVGGKIGVDATGEALIRNVEMLDDSLLLKKLQSINSDVLEVTQYFKDCSNPLTFVKVKKSFNINTLFENMIDLKKYIKIVIVVDDMRNELNNLYMLLWRVTNNIDAKRDLWLRDFIGVDATTKTKELDSYNREWPKDTDCSIDVLLDLKKRGLVSFDDSFIKRWHI